MKAIVRSAAYRERQREYDAARKLTGDRRAQVRAIQKQFRARNVEAQARRDKGRVKREVPLRMVGVDGEGQDFFVCKKCSVHTSTEGGACPKGGRHEITFSCTRCAEIDPPANGVCPKSEGGEGDG